MASILSRASVGWVLGWRGGGVTRRLGVKGTFHIYKFSRSHVGCVCGTLEGALSLRNGRIRQRTSGTVSHVGLLLRFTRPIKRPPLLHTPQLVFPGTARLAFELLILSQEQSLCLYPLYNTRGCSLHLLRHSQRHTPLYARLKAHHGLPGRVLAALCSRSPVSWTCSRTSLTAS